MIAINFYILNKNKNLQLLLSLVCGIFGILCFSPYDFWPASIISLTGLLIMILDNTCKQVIWNTLFWGIGFFSAGLHWIYIGISRFIHTCCYVNIILIIFLIIYLTCFPILFSILFIILRSFVSKRVLIGIIPILWSIIERFRGNTVIGFPWLQFGYSQLDGPMRGIAPIVGVEGITFVLVLMSSLLALSIKTVQLSPFVISLITLILFYPLNWIRWYHIQPQYITRIALVQGNVDQHLNWSETSIQSTLQLYLKHTLPIIKKTKIIIWPESAIPGNEISHNQFLTTLDNQLRQYQTCLITGIIDTQLVNNNYYHYNSIIVLGNDDPYIYLNSNRYNKHHLVLCAEWVPYQSFFKSILHYLNIPISFMQKGCYLQPQLNVSNIKITAAICYEIILGQQIRDNFKPDSNFLLTIANDIWFGDSIGPWQHFQMVRMRALELGRPILCCTNNGVTAIIRADGSIQAQLSQFISDVLITDVIPTTGITPYAKFGSVWLFSFILIFIIYIAFYKNIIKFLLLK